MESNQPIKVFLCHGSEDKKIVVELYRRLVADGVDAWLDVEKLLPGQNWKEEIPKAIRNSDVVLVCLSERSVTKEGYVQKEIKFAIDKAEEMPEGRIFLIPARLEECNVPTRLEQYQWVDIFDENGYNRLMNSLRLRARQIGASVSAKSSYLSANKQDFRNSLQDATMKVGEIHTATMDLQPKSLLTLGGSPYFVQKLISRKNSGNMIIRSAQASDQVMQEDVGILHISFATDQGNVEKQISRIYRKAQNMNQAAKQSAHLPGIKNIVRQGQEPELWIISQWIRGKPLSKHYPLDGPLPNASDINQILGWMIDICDGLTALHRLREISGGVVEDTIISSKGRGAVLIDAAFAENPLAWKLPSNHFDSRIDVAALGEVLYRTLTHQISSREPASQYNIQVSADLEALISKMRDGSVGKVLDIKRQMIQIRKKARL